MHIKDLKVVTNLAIEHARRVQQHLKLKRMDRDSSICVKGTNANIEFYNAAICVKMNTAAIAILEAAVLDLESDLEALGVNFSSAQVQQIYKED